MKKILLSIALCGMMGIAMAADSNANYANTTLECVKPAPDFNQLMDTLKTYRKEADLVANKDEAKPYFFKMWDLRGAFQKIEANLTDEQKKQFKDLFNEVVDILKAKE